MGNKRKGSHANCFEPKNYPSYLDNPKPKIQQESTLNEIRKNYGYQPINNMDSNNPPNKGSNVVEPKPQKIIVEITKRED